MAVFLTMAEELLSPVVRSSCDAREIPRTLVKSKEPAGAVVRLSFLLRGLERATGASLPQQHAVSSLVSVLLYLSRRNRHVYLDTTEEIERYRSHSKRGSQGLN